jgi:hypothetical protein
LIALLLIIELLQLGVKLLGQFNRAVHISDTFDVVQDHDRIFLSLSNHTEELVDHITQRFVFGNDNCQVLAELPH